MPATAGVPETVCSGELFKPAAYSRFSLDLLLSLDSVRLARCL
ncbi:MAG: hypothetical protein ACE5GO_00360 [Anaerolineales bacterium]